MKRYTGIYVNSLFRSRGNLARSYRIVELQITTRIINRLRLVIGKIEGDFPPKMDAIFLMN